MRDLVVGGAGFLGSHLVSRLVYEGSDVLVVDSLITGDLKNLEEVRPLIDVRLGPIELFAYGIDGPIDRIWHLGSPASPPIYQRNPLETLRAGSLGTMALLELAREHDARFLLASTSEVYGSALENPQRESYRGNVDPVGPRSMYDEAKRFSEAATAVYMREPFGIETRIARIFNTYGPRMSPMDGRLVPTFIRQALRGQPVTVHGDGRQTRSLCHVNDLVGGLRRLMDSDYRLPVNLGNPDERTVVSIAQLIQDIVYDITGKDSELEFVDRPDDDPRNRCPDIGLARNILDWRPYIPLELGLRSTIEKAVEDRW